MAEPSFAIPNYISRVAISNEAPQARDAARYFGTLHYTPKFGAAQHPGVLRIPATAWQEQSKGRKRCLNSQGNFRIIENSTADVEIWPYLMGPNFGQQNVVKTYNTCVVIFQILQYVMRVLIRVVKNNTRCDKNNTRCGAT